VGALFFSKHKTRAVHEFCVAGVGFEPTTFGLCLPTTVFTASFIYERICGLDFLFTLLLFLIVRVPAIKSLHLPSEALAKEGLARDYHVKDFPEFDRIHTEISFCAAHCEIKCQASLNSEERGFR